MRRPRNDSIRAGAEPAKLALPLRAKTAGATAAKLRSEIVPRDWLLYGEGVAEAFHLLGVSGSLREKSRTALALRLLLDFAAEHGAETRMLDLRAIELPLYRPDGPGGSAAELRLGVDMRWASAVVLASPDYHGSMSGTMKNFLDYNWEECAGKVFGYVCSSHEKGLTVMDQMRTVVRQCYGWSMPYGVSFDGKSDFDSEGVLKKAKVEARLRMLARDLVVYGALIHRQFLSDLAGSNPSTFAAAYR